MTSDKKISFKRLIIENYYLLIVVVSIILTTFITYKIYDFTRDLLRDRLDERLKSIVATAALQFDGDEIGYISEKKLKAVETETYKKNVLKLQAIRDTDADIMYAYVFAPTEDPNTIFYVVDADALSIIPTVDFNEDGVIDDEDVSVPGEEYDASEAPTLQGQAFREVSVDQELTIDTWGTFLSAYSPIADSSGKIVGSLTIDVEVSDFTRIVNATYLPFALFVVFLTVLIVALTISLIGVWRSRVEAVRDLDRQKDELLSIVSHQLAAPVTAVKWYLEMMSDEGIQNFSKDQQDSVKSLQSIGVNLSDLVGMILDVSRIQLGKMKVEKQKMNLTDFFKEILEVIEPKAIEKGVKFVKKFPENRLPEVLLDKRLTRMTVENLLTNAVKYTPKEGSVVLDVSIVNNKLLCSVQDTGCGIPLQDQPKIFGKLYRASNVRNSIDGNGFGLYIAKGAIEGQDGKIWFTSKENAGTTFFIELPLIASTN